VSGHLRRSRRGDKQKLSSGLKIDHKYFGERHSVTCFASIAEAACFHRSNGLDRHSALQHLNVAYLEATGLLRTTAATALLCSGLKRKYCLGLHEITDLHVQVDTDGHSIHQHTAKGVALVCPCYPRLPVIFDISVTSLEPGLAVTSARRGSKASPKVRVRRRKLKHIAFHMREAHRGTPMKKLVWFRISAYFCELYRRIAWVSQGPRKLRNARLSSKVNAWIIRKLSWAGTSGHVQRRGQNSSRGTCLTHQKVFGRNSTASFYETEMKLSNARAYETLPCYSHVWSHLNFSRQISCVKAKAPAQVTEQAHQYCPQWTESWTNRIIADFGNFPTICLNKSEHNLNFNFFPNSKYV